MTLAPERGWGVEIINKGDGMIDYLPSIKYSLGLAVEASFKQDLKFMSTKF